MKMMIYEDEDRDGDEDEKRTPNSCRSWSMSIVAKSQISWGLKIIFFFFQNKTKNV